MNTALEAKIQESEEYLSRFDETKDIGDLVEAVKLRNIKPLHDESFLHNVTDMLQGNDFKGYEWRMVLDELIKSYRKDLGYFAPVIEEKAKTLHCKDNFEYERQLLKILKELEALTCEEFHYRMAISCEDQGLNLWNNQKENTVYPLMPFIFKDAYQEIYKVRDKYPEAEKRIKEEYARAQKYEANIISQFGVQMNVSISKQEQDRYRAIIKNFNMECELHVFSLINNLPYCPQTILDKNKENVLQSSGYFQFFGTSAKIERDGNASGKVSAEQYIDTQCLMYCQARISFIIDEIIFEFIERKIEIDDDKMLDYMQHFKPSFIPYYALEMWFYGFRHALDGHYLESAYLLMPQVETALRGLAEEHCGDLTKLHKDSNQDEANLSEVLDVLKDYLDVDIYKNLNFFLNDRSGVNFRNKMSHGLLSCEEVVKNSLFLLKIAIDIFFYHKKFLKKEN